jgi:hypothetical protein
MNVAIDEETYTVYQNVLRNLYCELTILNKYKVNREVAIVITELEKTIAFLEYTLKKLE